MKTIYLTGHRNFNNRGCEAIVRTTIKLLKQHDKTLKFIVPSNNINQDSINLMGGQLGSRQLKRKANHAHDDQ